jgi:hypothetical protein
MSNEDGPITRNKQELVTEPRVEVDIQHNIRIFNYIHYIIGSN